LIKFRTSNHRDKKKRKLGGFVRTPRTSPGSATVILCPVPLNSLKSRQKTYEMNIT
jgi:hypothetical protein